MILVNRLSSALQVCYQSVYVKGETPLSLLLIAETDHGKSNLILNYIPTAGRLNVEKLSDASALGLYKAVKDKTDPVTLVIPDFHKIISHKASVTEGTINALMMLLQDGVMKVSVGPGEPLELHGKRANLLTAMTPGMLAGRAGRWRRLGFLRRMLPVNYTYSDVTAKKIHESIRTGEYHSKAPTFSLPVTDPQIVTISREWSQRIEDLAIFVSSRLENRGFTAHKFFRVFCQAHSLMNKRNAVNEQDYKALEDFSAFCNLDTPVQI